jgi:hypothetical protein
MPSQLFYEYTRMHKSICLLPFFLVDIWCISYLSIYWAVIFGLYSMQFIYKRILVGVFPYIPDRWQYSLLNVEQFRLLCVGLQMGTMKSIICIGTLTCYAQVDIWYVSRHLWEGHEQITLLLWYNFHSVTLHIFWHVEMFCILPMVSTP